MDLHFKTFGEGDPLIILHGLFGTSDNWQTLGKRFAQNYMVYLVDQRNHGRSPHDPIMDYPHMADDLRAFMQDNGIHRAHILGHSMGGKTAMEFALRNPDMTDRVIIVDIAPKTYEPGHYEIFAALRAMEPQQLADRQEADQILAEHIPDKGIRMFLLKNLTRNKEGGFRWKMNLEAIYQNYERILQRPTGEKPFHGEVLFIRGEYSHYIQPGDNQLIHSYFPHARIEGIPGAGHWVHAEAPDELHRMVTGFLAE